MSALPYFRWTAGDPTEARLLPRVPACYVIVFDGQDTYIGSCLDLRKRITQHKIRETYTGSILSKWGQHQSAVLKYRSFRRYGEWLTTEARLIRRLQPKFNKTGVRRVSA